MRRLFMALGTLTLLAGPALAQSPEAMPNPDPNQNPTGGMSANPTGEMPAMDQQPTTHTKMLHRWAFDMAGPQADVSAICNGAPASAVEVRRNAGDIAAGIFTLGWYTPVHVSITCGTH
jgi:hypothetical protein